MALQTLDRVEGLKEECIDNCFEAAEACEWCADECIKMGDPEMSECIRLCRDVADLTTMHARFMVRDSDYSADLAATCADACEACADECERFDNDHCQACAEALRECASTCREMASA